MKTNQENKKDNLINLFDEKGNRHGYWEKYYGDGKLSYKGEWVNGKEHGYWESYYDNGKLSYKGNYVNGKKDGYWESYFSNGQLYYKGNYVNGNRHGYWEIYYKNGQLDFKGFYDMGRIVSYNPDEPNVIELTMEEIADKFGVNINKLRIKK
jgi:antitoxin component YwqK of YwqJK toxin-antitoxin module